MDARDLQLNFECGEDWEAMGGEGARRHCARCDEAVTNLSGLTQAEAEALIAAGPGCIRYGVDASGEVVFEPEPPRPLDKLWTAVATAGVLLPVAGVGLYDTALTHQAASAYAETAPDRMKLAIDEALAQAQGFGAVDYTLTPTEAHTPPPVRMLMGDVAEPVTPPAAHPLETTTCNGKTCPAEPVKPRVVRKLMGKPKMHRGPKAEPVEWLMGE